MRRIFYAVIGLFCLCAGVAYAQAPERAGRLSYVEGAVSVRAPDDERWGPAQLNLPVTTGTEIWTQPGARAEIQVGAATIRIDGESEVDFVRLDDAGMEIAVPQGAVNVHRSREFAGPIWVTTSGGQIVLSEPGFYRVQEGAVARAEPSPTEFDRWAMAREEAEARTAAGALPYVSPDVTGYQDLATYGDWTVTPGYGAVWIPRAVPVGWAPYRYGHWAYVWPWGWTWIDDAPWGFAPFHYGSWIELHGRWGWWPGHRQARAVYTPARVVIVLGGEARHHPPTRWIPLAPHEVAPRVAVNVRVDVSRFTNHRAASALPHRSVVREASRREARRTAVAAPARSIAPRDATRAEPERRHQQRLSERPERTATARTDRMEDRRNPPETRVTRPIPAPDIRARLAPPPTAERAIAREPARAEAVERHTRQQSRPSATASEGRRESTAPRSSRRFDAQQPSRPDVQPPQRRENPRAVSRQEPPKRSAPRHVSRPQQSGPQTQAAASSQPEARRAPQRDRGAQGRHDRRDESRRMADDMPRR